MVVRVRSLPYGVDPDYLSVKSASVTTTLDQLDRERAAQAIPWWIIVLSAVAGVLLLLLLIYALHKVSRLRQKNCPTYSSLRFDDVFLDDVIIVNIVN